MTQVLKEQTRSQKIENLLVAIDMVKQIRPHKFTKQLASWSDGKVDLKNPMCNGGALCFGGWVAVHPFFRRKGVKTYGEMENDDSDYAFEPAALDDDETRLASDEVAEKLFGNDRLFGILYDDNATGHEKQVLLRKLNNALDDVLTGKVS